ncbi:MAG: type II toxin-antitoxin system HicA family toxin [Bacteroidales bacterium]
MKRIPRNLSGTDLIKKLKVLGYLPTRQVGSHIRLTTEKNGTHHITIPNHSPLRIGTLASIVNDISNHLKISKEELVEQLF